MYKCPHCGQPGITVLRKSCLGPALPAHCRVCNKPVGVPWGRSMLALSPLFVSLMYSAVDPFAFKSLLAIAVGFTISLTIGLKWVPLEAR